MVEVAPRHRFRITEDYSISRLIVGGWQFSQGHGASDHSVCGARELLATLVDRGLTTFDCADIYTGVEELFGGLIRERRGRGGDPGIQIHTKFVPDLEALPTISKAYVERIIDRSLSRLGVERLDLIQFHWWDYAVPGYVEVAHWLQEMQGEGKIRHLGVTNFDRAHLEELVSAGVKVVSNQVQYSVLDRRPGKELAPYCRDNGIVLLCYGGLSGGFLTDGYLGMDNPPSQIPNRSLIKYTLIIDEIGGWEGYQAILKTLKRVAERHGVPLPCVALRYILDQAAVAATITGLDSVDQAEQTLRALDLKLRDEDFREIDATLSNIPVPPGPVYGLERDREGPHGAIMRYDLNEK
jgi:aryl-alcohol dehydrogenase-like predicted oxidoreductase